MQTDCEWRAIERGSIQGSGYSVLRCAVCCRETAVVQGERVCPAQFSCPFEVERKNQ